VTVSHGWFDEAVQTHPLPAETAKFPNPEPAAKESVIAGNENVHAGIAPLPARETTVVGAFEALLVTVKLADSWPAEVGRKATVTVLEEPAPIVVGYAPVTEKSVFPVNTAELIRSVPEPLFVSVKV